jgi:hypothetical protein
MKDSERDHTTRINYDKNNANQTTLMEKIKGQNASFAVKRSAWLSSVGESGPEITEMEVDVEMTVDSL